jgi:hypothetical protein
MRNLASALAIGATAALVLDVILGNALAAAQSPGVSSMTPWWIVGHVAERSVWIAAACLLWVSAPLTAPIAARLWPADFVVTRAAALDALGRLMIATPLLWLSATLLILALRISLAGNWELDGAMFTSAAFYNSVLLGYLPWAGGGIVLLTLGRHASE